MKKNIVIAVVVFLNLVLFAVLIYVALTWRPSARVSTTVTPPAPVSDVNAGLQEFAFNAPGHFAGTNAPSIVNRTLAITATFDAQAQNGVIVAHGGLAHGYALYVQDGELLFALRRLNVLSTISAGKLAAGRHIATATLTKAGDLSLTLDGKPAASGKAPGVITMQPVDGLDIGADRGAPVGLYEIPNTFGGTIESVHLKTAP